MQFLAQKGYGFGYDKLFSPWVAGWQQRTIVQISWLISSPDLWHPMAVRVFGEFLCDLGAFLRDLCEKPEDPTSGPTPLQRKT